MLNLPSHATAGYLWSAADLGGEGFTLSPVLVDAREQKREGRPLVGGGGGDDRYFLSGPAVKKQGGGFSEFHLREARPWVADDVAATELALKMQFEAVEEGLSDSTRLREIQPQ